MMFAAGLIIGFAGGVFCVLAYLFFMVVRNDEFNDQYIHGDADLDGLTETAYPVK